MSARWLSVSLIAAMSMPGWAQSQLQDRFALTPGQVARALSAGGIPATEEQVSLLTRVVATESSPVLDVLSVEPLSKQSMAAHSPARSRVRLGCHLPGKCLPFYAILTGLEPPVGHRVHCLRRLRRHQQPRFKGKYGNHHAGRHACHAGDGR